MNKVFALKDLIVVCALLALSLANTGPTFAQGDSATPAADDVESILDRLEKRLVDQESDALGIGSSAATSATKNPKNETSYKFESQRIIGNQGNNGDLKRLSAMITKLENEVDQLTSRVQSTKQEIIDTAKTDNFITIDARLAEIEKASIKSLTVKLDGYNVYQLTDTSGLWIPSKVVPLYAGPLQPGAHRVDIEARLAIKHSKGLPFNSDVTRYIQKSFDIAVAGGTAQNKYEIEILPPKSSKDKADATMKEVLK